jgi:hypothetical protein
MVRFLLCSSPVGSKFNRNRRGRARIVVGLQLPVQSMSITTNVVRSIPAHGEVYSIQDM